MADLIIPNVHVAGTLAEADDVNGNMDAVADWVNANTVRADGTVAFTAVPTGPGLDPPSDNSLVRRRYVDKRLVVRQSLTGNTAEMSVDTTTDMALNNVPVIAGHTYGIHLHSQAVYNTLPGNNRCVLECKVNGTIVGRFAYFNFPQGAYGTIIDSMVQWTAPSTQSTDDITVFLDILDVGCNLKLEAAGTDPRTLTLLDLGVL